MPSTFFKECMQKASNARGRISYQSKNQSAEVEKNGKHIEYVITTLGQLGLKWRKWGLCENGLLVITTAQGSELYILGCCDVACCWLAILHCPEITGSCYFSWIKLWAGFEKQHQHMEKLIFSHCNDDNILEYYS